MSCFIKNSENFKPELIYGDYDVDGIVSSLICKQVFNSDVFIPNRLQGYNFIEQHCENLRCLVICDNGINLSDKFYNDKILLVIDHHEIKDTEKINKIQFLFWEKGKSSSRIAFETFQELLSRDRDKYDRIESLVNVAELADNFDYNFKKINQFDYTFLVGDKIKKSKDVSFELIPLLNSWGRMSNDNDCLPFKILDDFVNNKINSDTINRCEILRGINEERKSINSFYLSYILSKYHNFLLQGSVLFVDDFVPSGVASSIASNLSNYFDLVLVFYYGMDNEISCSVRCQYDILDQFINEIPKEVATFGGHSRAFGGKVNSLNELKYIINTMKIKETINYQYAVVKKKLKEVYSNKFVYIIAFEDGTEVNAIGPNKEKNEPVKVIKNFNNYYIF